MHDFKPHKADKDAPEHVVVLAINKFQQSMCNSNFTNAFLATKSDDPEHITLDEISFLVDFLSCNTADADSLMTWYKAKSDPHWRVYIELGGIPRPYREVQFLVGKPPKEYNAKTDDPAVMDAKYRKLLQELNSSLPDNTAEYKEMEAITKSPLQVKCDRIMYTLRNKTRRNGQPVTLQDTYVRLHTLRQKPPAIAPGQKPEKEDLWLLGNPLKPDVAMNRLNQRTVEPWQVLTVKLSMQSNTQFRSPERIIAVYPKVVYQRLLQPTVNEKELFDKVRPELLEMPENLEEQLEAGNYVARLIAGNHGYVAAAELVSVAKQKGPADRYVTVII